MGVPFFTGSILVIKDFEVNTHNNNWRISLVGVLLWSSCIVAAMCVVCTVVQLVFSSLAIVSARNAGKAELAQAESNRQIRVLEAHAKRESAHELAAAEIIRAEGVAAANQIIGDSLKGNEAYLRYLWIDGLSHVSSQAIYVPTEAGLPILEAGKRRP